MRTPAPGTDRRPRPAIRVGEAAGDRGVDMPRASDAPSGAGSQRRGEAWDVPDIRAEMEELRARGVRFEDYPEMNTRDGIAELGGEKAAWFKDPDGNILCIHETRH